MLCLFLVFIFSFYILIGGFHLSAFISIMISIFSTLISMFIGVVLYIVIDDKIRHRWFLEKLYNKYFIGCINKFDNKPGVNQRNSKIISNENSNALIKYQYKKAAQNFMYAISVTDSNIAVVTSVNPNEGKSTTASNIAVALAQCGKKILSIDSDMRKPSLHKLFSVENKFGLSDIYSRICTPQECIRKISIENLDIITGGQVPPNACELITQKYTEETLKLLSADYDYIIIDAPPMEIADDALRYSEIIGGILCVIKYNSTKYRELCHYTKIISNKNVHLLGFLMNFVNPGKVKKKIFKDKEI